MKFFFHFKHWQLFIIWYFTITMSLYMQNFIWIIFYLMYVFLFIGWIYSIGKTINKLNTKTKVQHYHEELWFVLSFIPFLPIGYFIHSNAPSNTYIMLCSIVVEGLSIFKLINFAAKSLKQYETNKELRFLDYIDEFVLITFSVIGIWIIQPKIKRFIDNSDK